METVKKTCQRVFQALRIDVNQEFEVLYEFMEKLPNALRPGGRAAILTFHSGEDKLVKAALKEGYRAGIYKEYSKRMWCARPRRSAYRTRVPAQRRCAGRSGRTSKMNIKKIYEKSGQLFRAIWERLSCFSL